MTADHFDEWYFLLETERKLMEEVQRIRKRRAVLDQPGKEPPGYRIALRPDNAEEDPMHHRTLLDDIVVNDVAMFRAEAMGDDEWWACCYLDPAGDDRICWSISAKAKPKRIEWNTTEWPESPLVYEHDRKAYR